MSAIGKPRAPRGTFDYPIACALLALLLGCEHAQSWTQYQLGGMTFYRSDDGTTGSSYELDGTTYSQFVGPDGKIERCSSYDLGGTRHTDCRTTGDNSLPRLDAGR
jgi:hypothetical protein